MAILDHWAMSLAKLVEITQQYTLHSGCNINWNKSNLLPLGTTISTGRRLGFTVFTNSIKYLDLHVS